MRLFVLSPDKGGKIDGVVHSNLLKHLPNKVHDIASADLVIVPITYFTDYQFNPKLEGLNKPYVLMDFMEYSTFWDGKDTHLFGIRHDNASNLQQEEWIRFHEWVKANPPVLYFKRELLSKDSCSTRLPIEFPCYLDLHPIQTREEFESRPIEVFNSWGYSNDIRPKLHGQIIQGMSTNGLGIISDWDHFHPYFDKDRKDRTWVSIYSPWYVRVPIADILWWHVRSKLMVSMPGAGVKCFRSVEFVNTIPAIQEDDMAWSYPFDHGLNCIKLRKGREFEDLLESSQQDGLYEIYLASQQLLEKYRIPNYINNYIVPALQKALK